MTLCAKSKPLSYMIAQFNFFERRLHMEVVSFSHVIPFSKHKKWMCLVSCKRHKGVIFYMPFANEFKCVSIHTGQKNSLVLVLSSIAAVNGMTIDTSQVTVVSADSRSLSLCFLICPFYATLVCVASKLVQIQPQTGMRSSTGNTTLCVIFLI